MTSLASAFVTIRPDTTGFGARLSQTTNLAADKAGTDAGKRLSSKFGSALKVGGLLAGAFAVTKGVSFFKDSISEASDLNESINAVNVTFGKNAGGIKRLGREAAESVGLSKNEFNGLAVQFSSFASTIAGKGGNVTKTMDQLTTRGADFASVMNLDVDEAMRVFQSGLAGETEPLRKFGIDLSAAKVESYAYAEGIAKAGKPLTEQQKVQARYALLMKATAKTQGDFANTSDGLANSQRRLGANFDNIKATIGGAVLPLITKLSNFVVDRALPAFSKFVKGMKDGTGAGGKLASIFRVARAGISRFIGFIVDNKEAVAAFVGILGGFLIINRIVKAVAAFNLVLAANPIGIVVVALAALAAGLVYAYKHSTTFRRIVDKAWDVIKKSVKTAWQDYIKPALAAMSRFIIGTLIPTIRRLWNNVVKPTFQAIGQVIGFVWRNVVKPAFAAWKFYMTQVLFPVIRFLWNNVVKPVFNGLGRTIGFVWRNVIRPTFNALKDGVRAVQTTFRTVVTAIGRIWESLKAAAKGPVRFVINTVIAGAVRALNLIPGVSMKVPKAGFSSGGSTGPGGKFQPAGIVHADEHVWTKEEVAKAGGHKVIEGMRKRVLRGYAKGGVVWPTIGRRTSTYAGHDGVDINQPPGPDYGAPIFAFRSGRIAYAGAGRGYGNAVFEATKAATVVYGHMSRILTRTGAMVRAGQVIGRVGSSGNSTAPHLHFGIPGGTYAQAMGLLRGASYGGGALGMATGMTAAASRAAQAAARRESRLRGILKTITGLPGKAAGWASHLGDMGPWGKLLTRVPGYIAGKAVAFGRSKLAGPIRAAASLASKVGGFISGGSGSVRSQVQRIAAARGWGSGAQWAALSNIISHESGWNPRAANPNSSARGLFQKMTSIHGPIERTVAGQTQWGLNYIKGRYGSPVGAWNYWQGHGNYDKGGIARGVGHFPKMTPRPERVLSPRQTVAFERLVDAMDSRAGASNGPQRFVLDAGGGVTLTGHIDNRVQGHGALQATAGRQRVR